MRLVVARSLERESARYRRAELTYPEHGATAGGSLPAGYRHLWRRVLLGHGELVLDTAAAIGAVLPTGHCRITRRSARRPSSSSGTPPAPSGWP
ncbi:hypothetical protein MXD63_03420 [Frankia sp. Cpl3]|nr:hypothetical protein [Frankia sp. Cpl3]